MPSKVNGKILAVKIPVVSYVNQNSKEKLILVDNQPDKLKGELSNGKNQTKRKEKPET